MKWSRSWIGTTLSAALLAGCASEEVVFVDMARARAAMSQVGLPADGVAVASHGRVDGSAGTIAGKPVDRQTAEAGARAMAVEALLREQTNQTVASLTAAYQRRAEANSAAEVAELRARLRRSLTGFDERLLESAERIIRSRAPQRGRLLARLAFVAAFPPSRPQKSPVPWVTAIDSQWSREAGDLKARIEAWDEETYSLLDRMVSQHHDSRAAASAAVSAQIRELRELARERASRGVASLLGDGGEASLGDLIADSPPPPPPSTSNVMVVLPAVSWRFEIPEWRDTGAPARHGFAGRLDIFLRVHGYKLARTARAGRDATGEFIAWLKTTHNGRSGS